MISPRILKYAACDNTSVYVLDYSSLNLHRCIHHIVGSWRVATQHSVYVPTRLWKQPWTIS
jgi:hypothetical protein